MTPKSPQLTPYDFLGYLVPGLAAIAIGDLSIAYHQYHDVLTSDWIVARYAKISWQGAIPLILLAYYIGHLVSFLSACSVERYAGWLYGQPSKFLMYGKGNGYFAVGGGRPWLSWLLRLVTGIFMLPCSWIELVFGKFAGLSGNYFRRFDPMLRDAAAGAYAHLHRRIGLKDELLREKHPSNYEFERLGLHYALETAPAHIYTLRNYVVMYGFLRSMTFILLVSSWLMAYHVRSMYGLGYSLLSLFGSGIVIFISYAAFLKFWVRYHREAIMAIIAVFAKENSAQQVEASDS